MIEKIRKKLSKESKKKFVLLREKPAPREKVEDFEREGPPSEDFVRFESDLDLAGGSYALYSVDDQGRFSEQLWKMDVDTDEIEEQSEEIEALREEIEELREDGEPDDPEEALRRDLVEAIREDDRLLDAFAAASVPRLADSLFPSERSGPETAFEIEDPLQYIMLDSYENPERAGRLMETMSEKATEPLREAIENGMSSGMSPAPEPPRETPEPAGNIEDQEANEDTSFSFDDYQEDDSADHADEDQEDEDDGEK